MRGATWAGRSVRAGGVASVLGRCAEWAAKKQNVLREEGRGDGLAVGMGSGVPRKLGRSPGPKERERKKSVFFIFSQIFLLFCFQSQFKHDQSQIQMGFQIYFFNPSKNEEFPKNIFTTF